jgi:hypothetical protein
MSVKIFGKMDFPVTAASGAAGNGLIHVDYLADVVARDSKFSKSD